MVIHGAKVQNDHPVAGIQGWLRRNFLDAAATLLTRSYTCPNIRAQFMHAFYERRATIAIWI